MIFLLSVLLISFVLSIVAYTKSEDNKKVQSKDMEQWHNSASGKKFMSTYLGSTVTPVGPKIEFNKWYGCSLLTGQEQPGKSFVPAYFKFTNPDNVPFNVLAAGRTWDSSTGLRLPFEWKRCDVPQHPIVKGLGILKYVAGRPQDDNGVPSMNVLYTIGYHLEGQNFPDDQNWWGRVTFETQVVTPGEKCELGNFEGGVEVADDKFPAIN